MQIVVGKSLKLLCFKNILLSTAEINKNYWWLWSFLPRYWRHWMPPLVFRVGEFKFLWATVPHIHNICHFRGTQKWHILPAFVLQFLLIQYVLVVMGSLGSVILAAEGVDVWCMGAWRHVSPRFKMAPDRATAARPIFWPDVMGGARSADVEWGVCVSSGNFFLTARK
jgi:hypothetical protein